MNRIYRLVWNRALRVMQVASELAHTTRGNAGSTQRRPALRTTRLAAAVGAVLAAVALPSWAATTPCTPSATVTCGTNGGTGGIGTFLVGGTGGTGDAGNAGGAGGASGTGSSGQGTYGSGGSGGGFNSIGGGDGNSGGGGGGGASGGGGSSFGSGGGGGGGGGSLQTGGVGGGGGGGSSGGYYSGGGGGGGGVAVTTSTTNSNTIQGGSGGDGGFGVGYGGGGGGGGGAAVLIGNGSYFINSGTLLGGSGGSGGAGGSGSYGGGGGGGGVATTGTGVTLTNEAGGLIQGGQGGVGGSGSAGGGAGGAGGAGVAAGTGSTIINAGSIRGGLSDDGTTRANAIDLSGGDNTLTLENGYSFTGNVVSSSGTSNGGDTLGLGGDSTTDGGAGDGSFDLSTIVASAPASYSGTPVYFGFNHYEKTGSSTWTLTDTGSGQNWQLLAGTLQVGTSTTTASLGGSHGQDGTVGSDGSGSSNGTVGGSGTDGSLAVTAERGTLLNVTAGSEVHGGSGGNGGKGGKGGDGSALPSFTPGGNGGTGGSGRHGGDGISGTQFIATNNGTIAGGNGGNGGDGGNGGSSGLPPVSGTGGSGGSGGTAISGTEFTFTNNGVITGGNGGNGGTSPYSALTNIGGTGGAGGAALSGSGFTLVNNNTIHGGHGGSGGNSSLPNGPGLSGQSAAGVIATGNSTIFNAGNISGGTQADAVDFSGGGNTLTLENGYSFGGNVVSSSGSTGGGDTLALGGDTDPSTAFDVSHIVSTAPTSYTATPQYYGFTNYQKTGNSTWTLTGNTTAVTPWTISAGTLSVSSDNNLGAVSGGLLLDGGALQNTAAFTMARAIGLASGGGTFKADSDLTLAGVISGTGALLKQGTGVLMLDGNSSAFAGTSTVQDGRLVIGSVAGNGAALGGNVTVDSGTTLGGHGGIGGNVDVLDGAHLAPGNSIGTLTIGGNASFAHNSQLDFEFGAPGANNQTAGSGDSVHVGGDLALDGAVLNVTDAGSMGPGLYNVFTYGGTLTQTNGGIGLGAMPAGDTLMIQSLTAQKQINLLATSSLTLNLWNGNGLATATQMGGGNGNWSATSPNWTDAHATVSTPMQPQPGFAIFGGAAGAVTVDDSAGVVSALGLQFATDGYTLDGNALTLVGDNGIAPVIRVGDGSSAGVDMTATIGNVLAGSDGLTKSDLGTLVLTGTNTYSGGTTISGGTLSVASDANLGAASSNLALDGGVLQVTGTTFNSTARTLAMSAQGGGIDIADAGNRFTAAQALSGSGALNKLGAGTLVLTGANTYSGGTLITAGTLQGDASSLQGNITNNAALVFDQTASGTFAGAISGSGSLAKSGTGTLTLTGTNTYTGGTTINAGTLLGDATSLQGKITNNAALVFEQTATSTFADAITGNGSLSLGGGGTLVLTGNSSSFAGSTTVQAGTLEVGDAATPSAALGGNVTVNAAGTLRGHGTIGGNVTNGGTVWAGGSIGTLTVQGNYVQAANGVLKMDATPTGQASLLNVVGTASLAGSSLVLAEAGTWAPSTDYTILTASGGVSGQFTSASSSLLFLNPVLSYGANAVTLSLQRNSINFNTVAQTPNQLAVATAANGLGSANATYLALTTLDAASARHAFDQLSGAIYPGTRTALIDDSRHVRDAVNRHLLGLNHDGSEGATADGVSVWTSVWGHGGHDDDDGNAATLQANGSGVLLGADLPLGNSRLGVVIGHGQNSIRSNSVGSSAHVLGDHAGLYASSTFGAFELRAGAAYAWQDVRGHRTVAFGSYSERLTSQHHAQTTQAYVEGGYRFDVSASQQLQPFVNLAHVRVHDDALQEGGGDAALAIAANSASVNTATMGLRDTLTLDAAGGIRAHASLGWRQAWGDLTPVSSMRFVAGGDSFAIAGMPVARHAVTTDLGIDFKLAKNVTVDASYLGQFASGVQDQGARMSLTVTF